MRKREKWDWFMTAWTIAMVLIVLTCAAVGQIQDDGRQCETDSECAAMYGGDGGPEPAE